MTTVNEGVRLVLLVDRSPYWLLLAVNEIQGWHFRLSAARWSSSQLESRHFGKAGILRANATGPAYIRHVTEYRGIQCTCISKYMFQDMQEQLQLSP